MRIRSRSRFPVLLRLGLHSGTRVGGFDGFATVQGRQSPAELLIELRQLGSASLVVFLEEPESLTHDLTGGRVPSRFRFGIDEALEFRVSDTFMRMLLLLLLWQRCQNACRYANR